MTNNLTPISRTAKPVVRNAKNVPVKRDINLISNRQAQEKIARRGLFLIAGVVFALGFAYFAFYLPLIAGRVLDATLQDINRQISAYSSTDEEFTKVTGQIKSLKAMSASLNASSDSTKSGYEYLKMIESACPGTVVLTQISLNPTDVTLTGVAASDNDVAQLVVNLQSYSDFTGVTVTSVAPAVAQSSAPSATAPANGTPVGRAFVIVATFPVADASAAPTEAPTASPSGNGGSGT